MGLQSFGIGEEFTVYIVQYRSQCTLLSVQGRIVGSAYSVLCRSHCKFTVQIVHCQGKCAVKDLTYSVQCTVFNVQCEVFSVNAQCTVFSAGVAESRLSQELVTQGEICNCASVNSSQ